MNAGIEQSAQAEQKAKATPWPSRNEPKEKVRRVLLLINPSSRRGGEARDQVIDLLERLRMECVAPVPENPDHSVELIRQHQDDVEAVVVGGGDGSIRSVLDEVMDRGIPLGIIPLGTANNLARNLGLPLDVDEACRVLADWHLHRIDVASVNEKTFLNVAGLGLSTAINKGLPDDLKRRWGVLSYVIYCFKVLNRIRRFSAEVDCDGQMIRVRAIQITVCNGRHYGAGLIIHEDAAIDDARLDLCSAETHTLWQTLRMLPALRKGKYGTERHLRFMRGQRIVVRTRRSMAVDADGELVTRTPADFQILPGALTVLGSPDGPSRR